MEKKFLLSKFDINETKEVEVEGKLYGLIKGYASTFNNIDRGYDRIKKGAFKKTLEDHANRNRQIRMYSQHQKLIGGFPEFKETDKGLLVSGNVNLDVQEGKEIYSLAKQGVISDLSIGYIAREVKFTDEEFVDEKNNKVTRTIRDILSLDLYEVSLVSEPMNQNAVITSIKSLQNITDVSKLLKQKGFSNKDANEIIYLIKSFSRNDEQDKNRNDLQEKLDNLKHNIRNESLNKKLEFLKWKY